MEKLRKYINHIREFHFWIYTLLIIVFIHALVGILAVIISYKNPVLENIFYSMIVLMPFFIFWISIFFELLLYKKYNSKYLHLIFGLFNGLIIFIQLIATNITLLNLSESI